jgi:ADP-ribosylglycohydrolase
MRERAEAMVLASFVADSHALGAHWIYDIDDIATRFGVVDELLPPPSDSFHAGKGRGAFTHYGDQTLLLLRTLAKHDTFDQEEFAREWRRYMTDYDGYKDHASQQTLASMEKGALTESGSPSRDLSAVGRIAPLAYLYRDEHEVLVRVAREQAAVTHNSSIVLDAAEYFAWVVWHVLNHKTPTAALRAASEQVTSENIQELVAAGLDSADHETRDAAEEFGQNCPTQAALPLTVHLIAKYEGSLRSALIQNVAAGGDSAARGMVAGMVLGAFHGRDGIPDGWVEDLIAYKEINSLLEDLEAYFYRNGASA